MADYFDEFVSSIPSDKAFRKTDMEPVDRREMLAYLLQSPWLGEIQSHIKDNEGVDVPRDELLRELMAGTDYDYGGAWSEMGSEMFGTDPNSGTQHGYSKAPSGRWLKSPDHKTAWKEIFWNKAGFSPDTAKASPHPDLNRAQASKFLRQY